MIKVKEETPLPCGTAHPGDFLVRDDKTGEIRIVRKGMAGMFDDRVRNAGIQEAADILQGTAKEG